MSNDIIIDAKVNKKVKLEFMNARQVMLSGNCMISPVMKGKKIVGLDCNSGQFVVNIDDTLMLDFGTKQVPFIVSQILPNDRHSYILNCQYILYQLLRLLKYKCQPSDFFMLKTIDKIHEHDDMWFKICERLKWRYQAL